MSLTESHTPQATFPPAKKSRKQQELITYRQQDHFHACQDAKPTRVLDTLSGWLLEGHAALRPPILTPDTHPYPPPSLPASSLQAKKIQQGRLQM